jgi:DNA-binding MarR family transcriptional regulator
VPRAKAVPPESTDLPPALRQRLGLLLFRAHKGVKRLAGAKLATLGLSTGHMGILEMLRATPGQTQANLATALEIDRTSTGVLVGELERLEIVERIDHPGDRRSYALRLTPHGRSVADRASALALAAQARFLSPLSSKEQEQLITLLQRLLDP